MTKPIQPRTGNRVLLVEDSRAISSLLLFKLGEISGINCSMAATLSETRALLAQFEAEIIIAILDLNLPDAPNGEVVDLVQSFGIPAIILTGAVDIKKRQQLLNHQVADYVSKNNTIGMDIVTNLVQRIYLNQDHRILVVDDSAAQRAYLCSLVQCHGYRTFEAENGKMALELLEKHPEIRLIITDYNMPVMDGLQMVKEIRRNHSPEKLGIIGVSGVAQKGTLAQFLKSGANDFLTKPYDSEELYCRIDQNLDMLRYLQEAREAAHHDFLTHLYTRRYFFESATELYKRAIKRQSRFFVAMIDADHFKRVNDTYGHQTGDQALIAIAGEIKRHSDQSGIPARFGGEEFVCIHELGAGEDPAALLENLRVGISQIELKGPSGKQVTLTVSIGATTNPMGSLEQMLELADQAVYKAKEEGRNRTVILD